jgi:fibronectin type 3 domain-containing protein
MFKRTAVFTLMLCSVAPIVFAAAPPVPASYQDLYSLLNSQIATFDTSVRATWDGTRYPTTFSSQLLSAESNNYMNLLGSTYYQYSVLPELQAVQAVGVKSITVHIHFPLLSAAFHQQSGTNMQDFVTFYKQLAQDVHARGLKMMVETSVGSAMAGTQAGAFTPYVSSLSWNDYMAGRAETALNIAQLIHPDYMTVMQEPDSEAVASAQPNVFTTDGATQLIGQIVQTIRGANVSGTLVGAGCGSWIFPFSPWVPVCTALPGLDFADIHIYPTNKSYLQNAQALADAAHSISRPVCISEAWAYKVRDEELGVLSFNDIYARDTFSFWSPIDIQFLSMLVDFSQLDQAIFVSAPWPRYFFSYIDYNQYGSGSSSDIMNAEATALTTALANAQFTSTGLGWENLILSAPDGTPPQPPTSPVSNVGPNVIGLTWNQSSDNVGVAGYGVFRGGVLQGITAQPQFTDQGLTSGVQYTYSIIAFDASGNQSAPNGPITIQTIDNQPPTVPTGVRSCGVTVNTSTLCWQAATDNVGVVGYRIFRGSSATTLTPIANVASCCSYVDNVVPGTTYFYAVAAYDAIGWTSPQSVVVSLTTPVDTTPPCVPGGFSATAVSATQINLSWSASSDNTRVANYRVYRGRSSTSMQQVGSAQSTAYFDTKASANTTYYYAIAAVDIYGNASTQTAAVSVTTPAH